MNRDLDMRFAPIQGPFKNVVLTFLGLSLILTIGLFVYDLLGRGFNAEESIKYGLFAEPEAWLGFLAFTLAIAVVVHKSYLKGILTFILIDILLFIFYLILLSNSFTQSPFETDTFGFVLVAIIVYAAIFPIIGLLGILIRPTIKKITFSISTPRT